MGGDEAKGQVAPPVSFDVFDERWVPLQAWFERAAGLPANVRAFTDRYGRFEDEAGVAAFTGALAEANDVARRLGGPRDLAREPAPGVVYTHLVRLAAQVDAAARTFVRTLGGLREVADPSKGDPASRAAAVRAALCGGDGLASTASGVRGTTDGLRDEIAALEARLLRAILVLNETSLIDEANRTIGALAYAAEQAPRQAHEAMSSGQAERASETQRKARLTRDVRGFFDAGNQGVAAVQGVAGTLRQLGGFFGGESRRLIRICTTARDAQLGNFLWVARALDLRSTTATWEALGTSARRFVERTPSNLTGE